MNAEIICNEKQLNIFKDREICIFGIPAKLFFDWDSAVEKCNFNYKNKKPSLKIKIKDSYNE